MSPSSDLPGVLWSVTRRFVQVEREQWLRPEALRQRQWRRFKQVLAHAYDRCPFYRERLAHIGIGPDDIRTRDDLAAIPLTTREDLRDPQGLIAQGVTPAALRRSFTSGSTGQPTVTYFDRDAWVMGKYLLKTRARLACRVRPWDRIALLQEGQARPSRFREWFLRQRGFALDEPLSTTATALQRFDPTILYAFPSTLVELGKVAKAVRPRLIFTSGETLTRGTRNVIERAFGVKPLDVYGCTEMKEIAWECPQRQGYHINSDWLLVEELPREPGSVEGALAVTSLYNYAMPLIRYTPGDTVQLLSGSCACGRGLPLMTPGPGRIVDHFRLPGGALVAPYTMTCAVEEVAGIRRYQILQQTLERVEVRIVPDDSFDDDAEQQVRAALEPILPGTTIRLTLVESLGATGGEKFAVVKSLVGTGRQPIES